MNDTPPYRDDASAAPEDGRNPWVSRLAWLVLAPVLYVLSVGPVVCLVEKGYLPEQVMFIYALFDYLPEALQSLLSQYLKWWS